MVLIYRKMANNSRGYYLIILSGFSYSDLTRKYVFLVNITKMSFEEAESKCTQVSNWYNQHCVVFCIVR